MSDREGAEVIRGRIDAQLRALHLPGALAHHRELAVEFGTDEHAYVKRKVSQCDH